MVQHRKWVKTFFGDSEVEVSLGLNMPQPEIGTMFAIGKKVDGGMTFVHLRLEDIEEIIKEYKEKLSKIKKMEVREIREALKKEQKVKE